MRTFLVIAIAALTLLPIASAQQASVTTSPEDSFNEEVTPPEINTELMSPPTIGPGDFVMAPPEGSPTTTEDLPSSPNTCDPPTDRSRLREFNSCVSSMIILGQSAEQACQSCS